MTETSPPTHERLAFDSDLFGFPVARLTPAGLDPTRLSRSLAALRVDGVRLAYAMVPWEDRAAREALEGLGAPLVDRKVTFGKPLPASADMPPGVLPWDPAEVAPDLEALALASGHQSRFKVDPRVPDHVFPALYGLWIRRSVAGEIADAVLVAREEMRLAGLVTLALHGPTVEIGLLAVDEAVRGRGIGRRLMAAAEAWGFARGARHLEVVTQGANEGACALYAACGCLVEREQAIYHVWMEPTP